MRLVSCPDCARHHRVEETNCPFCRHTTSRVGPRGLAAVALISAGLTVAGCSSPRPAPVYGAPDPLPDNTTAAPMPEPNSSATDKDTDDPPNPDASASASASAEPIKLPEPPVKALYGAPPAPDQNRD